MAQPKPKPDKTNPAIAMVDVVPAVSSAHPAARPANPIDDTRYQVINSYMGRCGLINSGGESGSNDLAAAVRTAVVNKRAGGMGLISGRKAFQKPTAEGVKLLNAIQDVYLSDEITIA
jgi:class I fructose-bisphosphate aldolase